MTQHLLKPKPSHRYQSYCECYSRRTTLPVKQVMQEMNCFLFKSQETGENYAECLHLSITVATLFSSKPSKADKFPARCIVHHVAIFLSLMLIPKVYIVISIRPSYFSVNCEMDKYFSLSRKVIIFT